MTTTSRKISFFEASCRPRQAGKTSFETLGGNVQLLTDAERRFTYYNLSLGYNFLPGEVFLGRNHAMTSGFYLLGGIGSTKFEGDQKFTVNFGAGFRVLPTDWLAIHIEAQDLVFKSDLLGTDRLRNNLIGTHRRDRVLLSTESTAMKHCTSDCSASPRSQPCPRSAPQSTRCGLARRRRRSGSFPAAASR